ncbi:MAG: hypothetical protein R3247_10630 [Rhodothermales bacterium]|nr:hypothetical protein [Rhodothermales bacterium]
MLASLRTYRLVAVLTAGTLLLSGSAPLVAHLCAWLGCETMPVASAAAHPCDDGAPDAPAMPMHERGVADAPASPPAAACCIYERTDAAPEEVTLAERTAVPSLSLAPAPPSFAQALAVPSATAHPPGGRASAAPPVPLHLLHGSFLS